MSHETRPHKWLKTPINTQHNHNLFCHYYVFSEFMLIVKLHSTQKQSRDHDDKINIGSLKGLIGLRPTNNSKEGLLNRHHFGNDNGDLL